MMAVLRIEPKPNAPALDYRIAFSSQVVRVSCDMTLFCIATSLGASIVRI
jgi:hypothetical protein